MFFNNKNNFKFFSFGRNAIYHIFENINLEKDDLVLIPNLICDVVLPPIEKFSNNIAYYSLNSRLEPDNIYEYKNVKVIFVVNYFGFPQDISKLLNYCLENQIILIEDNAHGIFSKDKLNNYLGTRADFGIFSYRKTFFLPDGAILFHKSINYIQNVNYQYWNPILITYNIKKILLFLSKISNINILLIFRKKYLRLKNTIKVKERSDNNLNIDARPIKYSINFLSNVNEKKEFNRRRRLYLYFDQYLKNYNIKPVFDYLPFNTCPYGYPFYVIDETELMRVIHFSNKCGFECVYWPTLPNNSNLEYKEGNIGKIYFINFTFQ